MIERAIVARRALRTYESLIDLLQNCGNERTKGMSALQLSSQKQIDFQFPTRQAEMHFRGELVEQSPTCFLRKKKIHL